MNLRWRAHPLGWTIGVVSVLLLLSLGLGLSHCSWLAGPAAATATMLRELFVCEALSLFGGILLAELAVLWRGLSESLLARGLELLGALPTIIFCAALARCLTVAPATIVVLVVGCFGALRVARISIRRILPLPAIARGGLGLQAKRALRVVLLTQIHELSRIVLQLVGLQAALAWLMPRAFGHAGGWGVGIGVLAREGARGGVLVWTGASLVLILAVESLAALASAGLTRTTLAVTHRPPSARDPKTGKTVGPPLPKPATPSK
jgi:hypothetical protein